FEERYWKPVNAPILGSDGEVQVIIHRVEDVTESVLLKEREKREPQEEVRRQRSEELTDFIENATVGLHWVGPDGTILWANRAELEMLGYGREEYVGRNIAEFHADPPVIADILRRLKRNEDLHSYEARLRCKDGSIRCVILSSNVLWRDGAFVHTRCFTRDITEARQAEVVRRTIEARYHALFQNTLDAIMIVDDGGRYADVHASMCRVFGRPREELIGHSFTA